MPSHPERVRRNYPEGVPAFGTKLSHNTCAWCFADIHGEPVEGDATGWHRMEGGVWHGGNFFLHPTCAPVFYQSVRWRPSLESQERAYSAAVFGDMATRIDREIVSSSEVPRPPLTATEPPAAHSNSALQAEFSHCCGFKIYAKEPFSYCGCCGRTQNV